MGRTTTFNYESTTGNLLNIVSPAVSGVGIPQVSMTYNGREQLVTVTEPSGIVSKFTYDTVTEKLLTAVQDFGTFYR